MPCVCLHMLRFLRRGYREAHAPHDSPQKAGGTENHEHEPASARISTDPPGKENEVRRQAWKMEALAWPSPTLENDGGVRSWKTKARVRPGTFPTLVDEGSAAHPPNPRERVWRGGARPMTWQTVVARRAVANPRERVWREPSRLGRSARDEIV